MGRTFFAIRVDNPGCWAGVIWGPFPPDRLSRASGVGVSWWAWVENPLRLGGILAYRPTGG